MRDSRGGEGNKVDFISSLFSLCLRHSGSVVQAGLEF